MSRLGSGTGPRPIDLVLSFPQWEGSGRGKHLVSGALAGADELKAYGPMHAVKQVGTRGDAHGVNRYWSIMSMFDQAQAILRREQPASVLTAGGDCSVDVPVIDYLVGTHLGLRVLWFDAHYDANTPSSSPSGNYHGMPVAAIMGHGPEGMRQKLRNPLRSEAFR